jgi:hypothetical protein
MAATVSSLSPPLPGPNFLQLVRPIVGDAGNCLVLPTVEAADADSRTSPYATLFGSSAPGPQARNACPLLRLGSRDGLTLAD